MKQFRVVESSSVRVTATVTDVDSYFKTTARMPRDNMFGEVVNLWLYPQWVERPDIALKRGVSLCLPDEDNAVRAGKAWELVKTVCHLPMLEHWRDEVLEKFQYRGWIKHIHGHHIDAVSVVIGEEVEHVMSELIREQRLLLSNVA